MTTPGTGNISSGGGPSRDREIINQRLEAQLSQNLNDVTTATASLSSSHNNGKARREIGENLAETQPTEGMSLINQLNSTLEELNIDKTGKFQTDTTGGFKFKVNKAYLEEKGFLVVQKDLLKLNEVIQEVIQGVIKKDPQLSEYILNYNYKVEIDPTRNVVNFSPSAEIKYGPEIINIKNIPKAYSPNEGIFEDYPIDTLIPVLVGPPSIDYLRRKDGEKTNMFSEIDNNSFEALEKATLEKATKQDKEYKRDFHLAHVLNIAMLPNGKWIIIDDAGLINTLKFPTDEFKRLLSPELVMNNGDIWNSRGNHAQPFYDTPLTPPLIRTLLPKLGIQVRQHQTKNGLSARFTSTESKTALVTNVEPFKHAASFHHLLHYYILYPLLKQDGRVDETMPPAHKGFLCETNGANIGPAPSPNSK
jgi:hypothetical protein